jgi:exodeoxyribonuclease VII small subunit
MLDPIQTTPARKCLPTEIARSPWKPAGKFLPAPRSAPSPSQAFWVTATADVHNAIVAILVCALECSLQPRKEVSLNSVPNKAAEPQRKGDFEKSLARLEEVVKRLESADLSLDEAMSLFEEGVKLSRECQKKLEEAEGKVEILLKKADGKFVPAPFGADEEGS